eukprot:1011236-Rhodomonas_salina.1
MEQGCRGSVQRKGEEPWPGQIVAVIHQAAPLLRGDVATQEGVVKGSEDDPSCATLDRHPPTLQCGAVDDGRRQNLDDSEPFQVNPPPLHQRQALKLMWTSSSLAVSTERVMRGTGCGRRDR